MQPRAIGLDLYRDIPYEPGHEELKAQLAKDNAIAITKLPDAETMGVPPPPTVPKKESVLMTWRSTQMALCGGI